MPTEKSVPAPMDKGLVHVSAPRPLRKGQIKPLPTLIVSVEHYNRIMRILRADGAKPRRNIRAALRGGGR